MGIETPEHFTEEAASLWQRILEEYELEASEQSHVPGLLLMRAGAVGQLFQTRHGTGVIREDGIQ